MDWFLPPMCKNFGPLKYADDQNKRLLHSRWSFLPPYSSVSGWKALQCTVKADSPWYHCAATVTNAICEQACCSELPQIYPVETFNLQRVCMCVCLCRCVCDWRGQFRKIKVFNMMARVRPEWDGAPSAKFGETVTDWGCRGLCEYQLSRRVRCQNAVGMGRFCVSGCECVWKRAAV